ncbi:peptidase M15A [Roseibium denhamense]|uniref:Lysozyme family protein n=1 Tax=Roseibium denhamense TaxID=76305 RepID=A0ABY1NH34_9HYPH|nr:D-Ala-D-Ala carboxypeptidase family metallohydrolase [Roseibium denhamense]MTI04040.1 peptidase M15A [Roseibium denhamense]SMP07631.1 Lysozyme family protein [Roseibium denhamense]
MSNLSQDIDDLFADLVSQLSDPALTGTERQGVLDAAAAIKDEAFENSLKNFRLGTAKFNTITARLTQATANVTGASLRKRIGQILDKLGDLQADFTEPAKGTPPPPVVIDAATGQTAEDAANEDETDVTPTPETPPDTSTGGSIDGPVVTAPNPSGSTKFADLEGEYKRLFVGARFRSQSAEDEVLRLCRSAVEDQHRYETVGTALGVPWWFIAAIHLLESGRNFKRHMHNGDKLTARTTRVPAGHPKTGSPPFTWEESALDAMKLKNFHKRTDWSLARALYRLEAYNGFGYRSKGVPTPYLWSLTTLYMKGKYASDGVYDPNLVSKQCGAAAFLRGLVAIGAVEADDLTGVDAGEAEPQESGSSVINPIPAEPAPPPPVEHAFKLFVEENLPDVHNFRWDEFLVKGASHANPSKPGFGLNTDPPAKLWPNVIPLAKALQAFREAAGAPVKLTNVYRSEAYNKTLPGAAKSSQHLTFKAADIMCSSGTPRDWQKILIDLRSSGVFTGGIGLYRTFVHIDVRGTPANWKGKGV